MYFELLKREYLSKSFTFLSKYYSALVHLQVPLPGKSDLMFAEPGINKVEYIQILSNDNLSGVAPEMSPKIIVRRQTLHKTKKRISR